MTSSSLSTSPKPPPDSRPGAPQPDPKKSSPALADGRASPGQPPRRRPRWLNLVLWGAASLLLFTTLTMQDRLSEPDAVPYTEFKHQVTPRTSRRCSRAATSIEGELKKPRRSPATSRTSTLPAIQNRTADVRQRRSARRVEASGATVRATPLVQQRGFITNLLFSIAPMLLLFGFYFWMFRRQQSAMGGDPRRRQAETRRS